MISIENLMAVAKARRTWHRDKLEGCSRLPLAIFLFLSLLPVFTVRAEWEGNSELSGYYTDNVGLFSVSRRLSLEEDPTQPVLDEPERGSDFVYEPRGELIYHSENSWGRYKLGINAAAYVFQEKTKYTHGFYEFQYAQEISERTEVKLFYDLIPNLFLGAKRAFHETIKDFEADEIVDSHIASLHIDHKLDDRLIFRSLVRLGMRIYNPAFEYRYHHFFTVGTHLEWQITPDIEFLIGYHFERGFADGKQTESFYDDVSYINNYTSAELKLILAPRWILMLIGDYEHNDLLSDYAYDIHHDARENVFQGEIELLYELDEHTTLKTGWQSGYRKYNFEESAARNNNIWLGLEYRF